MPKNYTQLELLQKAKKDLIKKKQELENNPPEMDFRQTDPQADFADKQRKHSYYVYDLQEQIEKKHKDYLLLEVTKKNLTFANLITESHSAWLQDQTIKITDPTGSQNIFRFIKTDHFKHFIFKKL